MKKKYFLCAMLIALVQTNVTHAQNRGGGNGPQQGEMKIGQFNAKNALGIVTYNATEVCDEAKVKEEGKRQLVTKAITEYNREIDQFYFQHTLTLSDIELMVNSKQKEAVENKNLEALKENRLKANELLAPYRDLLEVINTKLNEKLEKALSEKEFKRWSKYNQKKKEALNPKAPNNTNNNMQQRGMSSGQQGSQGRRQQRYY